MESAMDVTEGSEAPPPTLPQDEPPPMEQTVAEGDTKAPPPEPQGSKGGEEEGERNVQLKKKPNFKECFELCCSALSKLFSFYENIFQAQFSEDGTKLFFIAVREGSGVGLFYVPTDSGTAGGVNVGSYLSGHESWIKITEPVLGQPGMSNNQDFMAERKRTPFLGFLGYQDVGVFGSSSVTPTQQTVNGLWVYEPFLIRLYLEDDRGSYSAYGQPLQVLPVFDFVEHKPCPYNGDFTASVAKGELFLMEKSASPTSGRLLTGQLLTHVGKDEKKHISAGQPSFCTMEEFDRFTGFWWQPKEGFDGRIYRILFEESDETKVLNRHTYNPFTCRINSYKYPDAGTENSVSSLKILELWADGKGSLSTISKNISRLPYELNDLMPDYEYLVQCGWMPNGKSIWMQLLNRRQTELRLIVLPLAVFCVSDSQGQEDSSVDSPPTELPMGHLILQEKADDWLNMSEVFNVISYDDDRLTFIWLSEASGYHHLEYVEAQLSSPPASLFNRFLYQAQTQRKQLTTGPWVVMPTEIWVDKERQLVYFHGMADTPLEQHLYVVSYAEGVSLPTATPTRLTEAGYSHTAVMHENCSVFYDNFSSLRTPPQHSLFGISHDTGQPHVNLLRHITRCKVLGEDDIPPHQLFSFPASTGEELHGILYLPKGATPGTKYPTIVYVYGGPRFQLVKNAFPSILRYVLQWTANGFCVVCIDNRGAYYRGKAFEAYLHRSMGKVEVEDQVSGLQHIADKTGCIDMNRVGITGWSYGGYMSLVCLAQRPDVFKVAVSGAPVTLWLNYDTGYTERYLGLVEGEGESLGQQYFASSVTDFVSKFPDEPGCLLIVHGTDDDNVFLQHSHILTSALNKAGKPYQLQTYPGEKHGIHSHSNIKHLDATILSFFLQNL